MKRRLLSIYHYAIAMMILARVFLADVRCPNCLFDNGYGLPIRCLKHHERQFTREGRAFNHLDKSELE